MNQPIELKYDDLQERLFKAVALAPAPLLLSALAEALRVPVAEVERALNAMVMNGAPLRFHTLPEGRAVSY